jgi:hypothetical protein
LAGHQRQQSINPLGLSAIAIATAVAIAIAVTIAVATCCKQTAAVPNGRKQMAYTDAHRRRHRRRHAACTLHGDIIYCLADSHCTPVTARCTACWLRRSAAAGSAIDCWCCPSLRAAAPDSRASAALRCAACRGRVLLFPDLTKRARAISCSDVA